ncbi:carboxypeptidase regulatory-like domain-containing protein [bacterium]|nr:carboxypeptidase regulatory-like domain-containing protein [bacterium]
MKTIANFIISLTFAGSAYCQETRTVKVTVTEENGTPIESVNTTVTFLGYSGETTQRRIGVTNLNGFFQASGEPELRISVRLERDGYYSSESGRLSRTQDHEVKFILRKVVKPLPLHAREVTIGFPVNREWIGYDFQVGDWVKPYGSGKIKDALFRCDTENTGERRGSGEFEIKFKEDEGLSLETDRFLQTSELKMPHEAPFNGYNPLYSRKSDSYHDKDFKDDIGYFFRSRVEKQADKIVSSNYGKIVGNIRFDPRESGWHVSHRNKPKSFATISFTYYFNPTPNDRNLEFDPKRNLFTDLESTEQVREP